MAGRVKEGGIKECVKAEGGGDVIMRDDDSSAGLLAADDSRASRDAMEWLDSGCLISWCDVPAI